MIERCVGQEPEELAKKLNEVIELVNSPIVPLSSRPQPGNTEMHITYIAKMVERLETGPYRFLAQLEPTSDLVKAVGEALARLRGAAQSYKESLGAESELH